MKMKKYYIYKRPKAVILFLWFDIIFNILVVILYINGVIRGGGGYIKRWHDDRGEGGVWNGPKKDYIIYVQPLSEQS